MGAPTKKVFRAVLVLAAAAGSFCSGSAEDIARVVFTEATQFSDTSPFVTAVGLRAAPADVVPPASRILLLVDTSASQTGTYRERSFAAAEGVLDGMRKQDRVLLAAVDVGMDRACNEFVPASTGAVNEALTSLRTRTPLGHTDLIAVLEAALATAAGDSAPTSIVYIGDGPGLTGLEPHEFARTIDTLRRARVVFSCIGIGPQVNWPCLAAVASATGGVFLMPDDTISDADAGHRVARAAVEPVLWPEDPILSTTTPDAGVGMLPTRMPPLRSDRDTVILLIGQPIGCRLDVRFERTPSAESPDAWEGNEASFQIPDASPSSDNAYLDQLARNAFSTDGIFLPLLGRESLPVVKAAIREEAATLAALSRQAEASGAHAAAVRLAEASLRRDPDNPEAAVILAAVRQTEPDSSESDSPITGKTPPGDGTNGARANGKQPPLMLPAPRPESLPLSPRETVDLDELREAEALRKIRAEAMEQKIAVELRDIRHTMAANPDQARIDLKELQRQVRDAADLDDSLRGRLERQIEISLRESIVRAREKMESDLAAERALAVSRERARLDGELRRREQKFEQLTERYRALVEEGIHLGYQVPTRSFLDADRDIGREMGIEAPPLYANQGVSMPARTVARSAPLVARILNYDTQNMRNRREMQRGFMDSLHLADVAAIPFPDEPPIIYPSAARWKEITRLREKYKAVDLAAPGSSEEKIYKALENTVQNFNFNETPLRDVIAQIEDSQGIPVQLDARALEDAGLDAEVPLTKNLSGVSLRSALRLLLEDLDLTYLIKDEVLMITTREKAQENLIIKVYPVADLVIPVNPSGGVNPFQTGGGLGGAGGVNSGQGGGIQAGGGMGGGMFQVADAADRAARRSSGPDGRSRPDRVAARPDVPRSTTLSDDTRSAATLGSEGRENPAEQRPSELGAIPDGLLEQPNLTASIADYLAQSPEGLGDEAAERELGLRMAKIRGTAAVLGTQGRYSQAADLLAAVIAAGHAEPWMYESLAIALEAAGRPRADVERAILSAADFASSPTELLQLATYLSRFGSKRQAIRLCKQVIVIDPTHREACGLAMTLAAETSDTATLRWACYGVLANEWPADQQELPARAARLAKLSIESLRMDGKNSEAEEFAEAVDMALVRDIELELLWNGDADIDLVVEEPPGTVCSMTSPQSTSGGFLLADRSAAAETPSDATQRERYVASEAFPGTYRVLIRRAIGKVAADTITAQVTMFRGTEFEQTMRKQLPLTADEAVFTIELPAGRRRQPLAEAQIAQDVSLQREIGKAILAQQLAQLSDPATARSLAESRPRQPPGGQLPFSGGNAVGYQPIISTLPEGTNLQAMAVVSADRRYVRVTSTPLFSAIGQVTQFTYSSGGAQGAGGAGGAGGGMGGGGMGGGGMGGGGMGGGGMGGGGMGGGGMGGGGGGMF